MVDVGKMGCDMWICFCVPVTRRFAFSHTGPLGAERPAGCGGEPAEVMNGCAQSFSAAS